MEELREVRGFSEAVCAGKSWDPRRNAFYADSKVQKDVDGLAFDRILYVGGVFVQSYLVGVARLFSDAVPFCLSDHYGLLGVMDVHESHGAVGARAEGSRRRLAVSRLRDVACAKERSVVAEQERERIQRDKEEQMAKEEGRLAEAHEEMLRDAKKRYDARLALRRQAFGELAMFGPGGELRFARVRPAAPDPPSSVGIEAYNGLLGVGGEVAWSRYVLGGFPSPAGFGGKGVSYATVFAQVMLRLPSVALWLQRHAEMCRVGVRCLACGVRDSRGQLGRVAPAAVVFRARMAGPLY